MHVITQQPLTLKNQRQTGVRKELKRRNIGERAITHQ